MDKYYKTREGKLYTDYTRQEILESIDINDFSTWLIWLERMDYLASKYEYDELCRISLEKHGIISEGLFGKYLARMRLWSYRKITFADSEWYEDRIREYYEQTGKTTTSCLDFFKNK